MSLDIGRVAAVHEGDNSVDLVMVKDGARLAGVQVLSWAGSTRSGHTDLATPADPPSGDKWDLTNRTESDMIAIVGYVGRQPIVIGFLLPQICQMLFDRHNFSVERHASDVYRTIDKDGNIELSHPSGTHIRIAETPDHEDLTRQDTDQNWKIDRNTSRAPWVSLVLKNAGTQVARLRIDPSGNVTVENSGDYTQTTTGNYVVNAATATFNIGGLVDINSPSLTHNAKNVGDDHKHSGVQAGASNTGNPI